MDNDLVDGAFPIKVGGKEFQTCRLTDKDYADLDGYIKSRYLENAFKAADGITDEYTKKDAKSSALRDVVNVGWGTAVGNDIIWADDGIAHIGHRFIRKRQPQIDYEQFLSLFNKDKVESIKAVMTAWQFFNPVKEESGGSSTGNDKSE